MQNLEFTSKLDFKEYLRANYSINYSRPFMIILTVFGVILILIGLFNLAYSGNMMDRHLWFQLVFGIYFVFFIPIIIYFKSKKNFTSPGRLAERMFWTIDPEWITVKGESFETKMTWDKMVKVIENKNVFLIYQSKLMAHIVSKKEMTVAQRVGFRNIVKGVLNLKHKLLND